MKKLIIVASFLGLGLAAGCGNKGADLAAKAKGYATQMCACKDKTCADGVEKSFNEWKRAAGKGDKPEESVIKQINAARSELSACRDKFDVPPVVMPPVEPVVVPPAAGSAQ